jgi:hypothetical protein
MIRNKRMRENKTVSQRIGLLAAVVSALFALQHGQVLAQQELTFEKRVIAADANMWWARALGDVNGDGFLDVALQDNNARGGWLGWLEGSRNGGFWKRHIIANKAPGGGTFACGDLDVGDIDRDGDLDLLGFEHPGEWDAGGVPTDVYWFSNPDWTPRRIGRAPAFVKDVNLVDLNGDDKLDLVTITYGGNKFTVFRQDAPDKWSVACEMEVENLHEGMDVGDIDGDGDADVATNGYWLENPAGDLSCKWIVRSVDAKWYTQDGDWSKNGTKTFCRDITGDGRVEVFISHSERAGYPVSWYSCSDPKRGKWTEHIIAEDLVAVHTLQVFDFDLDGDFDVLTGVNKNRAKGLDVETWPAVIYLNQGEGNEWRSHRLTDEGIYNGQAQDVDGDGDCDIIRLPTHDGQRLELLINQIRR